MIDISAFISIPTKTLTHAKYVSLPNQILVFAALLTCDSDRQQRWFPVRNLCWSAVRRWIAVRDTPHTVDGVDLIPLPNSLAGLDDAMKLRTALCRLIHGEVARTSHIETPCCSYIYVQLHIYLALMQNPSLCSLLCSQVYANIRYATPG